MIHSAASFSAAVVSPARARARAAIIDHIMIRTQLHCGIGLGTGLLWISEFHFTQRRRCLLGSGALFGVIRLGGVHGAPRELVCVLQLSMPGFRVGLRSEHQVFHTGPARRGRCPPFHCRGIVPKKSELITPEEQTSTHRGRSACLYSLSFIQPIKAGVGCCETAGGGPASRVYAHRLAGFLQRLVPVS